MNIIESSKMQFLYWNFIHEYILLLILQIVIE